MLLVGGLTVAVGFVGCAGSDDESDDDTTTPDAGYCIDASNSEDILVVDCESPAATAQVLGTYEPGRCPSDSFAIDSTQTLDGREVPDGDVIDICAKDLDKITEEDLAKIDEIVNPTYHGLPIVGYASGSQDGPEPETAECLDEGREISGASDLTLSPVGCDSDEAAWDVIDVIDGDNGVYLGDDCPSSATAAATIFGTVPTTVLCIVPI